jgi:UDP-N-acetylglucosamine 2-epimerase (hydrolysing)
MLDKKILFVTGTRADFGKLEPLAIAAKNTGFSVTFFVTGMHMLSAYGLTKKEVHRAGFNVVEFLNQREDDSQDVILNKTISGFSDFLREYNPDLVIVHGDRVEALACALVCSMNYFLCAHIEGGEVSGTIDEVFRHCITKLADIHLVSSQSACRRILRMGEMKASVEVIGSPELDIHMLDSGVNIKHVLRYYEIDSHDYGICIFHPVTSELKTIKSQAENFFSALEESHRYFVVILPNNDPGSDDIVKVINKLSKKYFRTLPSVRFNYFSELMKNAKVMVGNSSAGVREAPFLGLPSLDIGSRQSNRSSAPSITSSTASDSKIITSFLQQEWGKKHPQSQEFGRGVASKKFLALLLSKQFWDRSFQKYFNDTTEDE